MTKKNNNNGQLRKKGRTDSRKDGRTDGRTEGRTTRVTDGQTFLHKSQLTYLFNQYHLGKD